MCLGSLLRYLTLISLLCPSSFSLYNPPRYQAVLIVLLGWGDDQWIKCLPCRRKDPSFKPHKTCKKAEPVNPGAGNRETGGIGPPV